jgi:hypothetical protein
MSGFERGIFYIATGPSYVAEAVGSAQSVREVWPDIPLALVADAAPPAGYFDHFEVVEAERSSRDKPRLIGRSPFERTIFLDTDTYCCAPLPELFDQLDRFEFLAAFEDGRFSTQVDPATGEEQFVKSRGIPDSFPELNAGVMAFRRSPATTSLFERWIVEYDKMLKELSDHHDQPSLRSVLYRSKLRFGVLPSEYNFRLGCPGFARTQIKIIHGRWTYQAIAPTRRETLQALDRTFNTNHGPRVFVPALGIIWGHGPLAHSPADPERILTLAPVPEPVREEPRPTPRRRWFRGALARMMQALRGRNGSIIDSAATVEAFRQTSR